MSLFTATLLASFFIVGLPHIFPCPAPRKAYADSATVMTPDGPQQRVRKRRRKVREGQEQQDQHDETETAKTAAALETAGSGAIRGEIVDEVAEFRKMEQEAKQVSKLRRECPVPKPRGIVGTILGFDRDQPGKGNGSTAPPADTTRQNSS